MKKVTAKKVERLRKAIWDYLEEKIRKPDVEIFGSDHAKGGKWDPIPDVGMGWNEGNKWISDFPTCPWGRKEEDRRTDETSDLKLYYDGGGYDYLSPHGELPEIAEKHQSALSELAWKLDFFAEGYDSTSLAFYYEG
jgi:hypothetical protein